MPFLNDVTDTVVPPPSFLVEIFLLVQQTSMVLRRAVFKTSKIVLESVNVGLHEVNNSLFFHENLIE